MIFGRSHWIFSSSELDLGDDSGEKETFCGRRTGFFGEATGFSVLLNWICAIIRERKRPSVGEKLDFLQKPVDCRFF